MGVYIWIWLGVAAAMAIIEALSLTLITVWFVAGGLAAFLAAWAGADIVIQIAVFLVVSIICLVLFRPLALKHRAVGESHESTPVGLSAIVVEPIDNASGAGRVETPDHMTWAAVSADGRPLGQGTRVRVVDQVSVRLVVEEVQ